MVEHVAIWLATRAGELNDGERTSDSLHPVCSQRGVNSSRNTCRMGVEHTANMRILVSGFVSKVDILETKEMYTCTFVNNIHTLVNTGMPYIQRLRTDTGILPNSF